MCMSLILTSKLLFPLDFSGQAFEGVIEPFVEVPTLNYAGQHGLLV